MTVGWRQELIQALDDLLLQLELSARDPIATQAVFARAQEPGASSPEALAVLRVVEKHPRMGRWDGKIQYSPSMGRAVAAVDFASWLTSRAAGSSSASAVAALEHFLASERAGLTEIFVIDGVHVTSAVELDAGMRLVPLSDVSTLVDGRSMLSRLEWSGLATPVSAVTVEFDWPLEPVAPMGRFPTWPKPERPQGLLYALGLATGTAPAVLREWTHVPPDIPMVTSGTITYGVPGASPVHELTSMLVAEVHGIAERMRRLDPSWRDHLEVPLQRYWAAQRTADPVSRAIDLGIALESLLLDAPEGPQRHRGTQMCRRGSTFLSATRSERKDLTALIGTLYAARCHAVHTGRLTASKDVNDPAGTLEQGLKLVQRLLTGMIATGRPNWDELLRTRGLP